MAKASEVLVQKVTELSTKVKKKTTINKDVTTEFSTETNKIIIPSFMTKKEAADDLMNQWNNEEQFQDFVTQFDEWDWKDALIAVKKVMEAEFGWIKGFETFWKSPTEVAVVVDIKNGSKITETGYAGPMKFPAWEEAAGEVGISSGGKVYVAVKAKKKFSILINKFFNDVRNHLQTQSIYRGKAIIVATKKVTTKAGVVELMDLELTEIRYNDAIFLNEDQETVVDNFIIDQLTDHGKRTYLFHGGYGNGKTETAINIGTHALKHNMSFFYIKEAGQFTNVLGFAKNYEPCMLFLEDIDQIAAGEARTGDINQILNTLDGVDTKGRDIITLFTTNHKDNITPALRRPGRIDQIVEFPDPDFKTKQKIMEYYFKRMNGAEELDYELLAGKLPEASGATVAEICKRAVKLGTKKGYISDDIVTAASTSMKSQVEFMKEKPVNPDKMKNAFYSIASFLRGDEGFDG